MLSGDIIFTAGVRSTRQGNVFSLFVSLQGGGYPMASGPRSLPWSLVLEGGTLWSCHWSCLGEGGGTPVQNRAGVPPPLIKDLGPETRGTSHHQDRPRVPLPLSCSPSHVFLLPLPAPLHQDRTGYPLGGAPLAVTQEDFLVTNKFKLHIFVSEKKLFEKGFYWLLSNACDIVHKCSYYVSSTKTLLFDCRVWNEQGVAATFGALR